MATKVITGKVRLCWPNLFVAKKVNDQGDPKFSVMLLVPKTDTATMEKLREAEAEAAERDKGKWNGKVPGNLASIIHDADEDGTAEDYPERAGCYYLTVSAGEKYRPGIVGPDRVEIDDHAEIYSGVYARVSLRAYGYNTQGNKGVSFGLGNVQKLADGEPLDGRVNASDEFDAVEGDDVL